jgi:phage major head subunit gpT-like protein
MAIIGTGLTTPGLKANFFKRLDFLKPLYGDLTTRISSTTKTEQYAFMGSVPPMREWGTGRKAQGIFTETYNVENLKYEATLEVDRDELADDQHDQIRARINELADRVGYHKDNVIATLLVNGGSAGFLAYDGKTFFANDHESGKSGVQDNTLSLAITDKDDPTSAEFRSAFADAVARLLGFVDDQAEPMSVSAGGLVCVVPPSMYVPALEALNATMLASTQNVLQGAAKVVTFPRLTGTDVWYLLKTDVAIRPFIFQDREPIEFDSLEADSDRGFIREVYLYGIRARYRITYGYWQYALQVTFTTA